MRRGWHNFKFHFFGGAGGARGGLCFFSPPAPAPDLRPNFFYEGSGGKKKRGIEFSGIFSPVGKSGGRSRERGGFGGGRLLGF